MNVFVIVLRTGEFVGVADTREHAVDRLRQIIQRLEPGRVSPERFIEHLRRYEILVEPVFTGHMPEPNQSA